MKFINFWITFQESWENILDARVLPNSLPHSQCLFYNPLHHPHCKAPLEQKSSAHPLEDLRTHTVPWNSKQMVRSEETFCAPYMQWICNLIIWLLLTRLCQASHEEFTFVYQFTLAKTAVCAKDFKVWNEDLPSDTSQLSKNQWKLWDSGEQV